MPGKGDEKSQKYVALDKIVNEVGGTSLDPTSKTVITDMLNCNKDENNDPASKYGGGTGIKHYK